MSEKLRVNPILCSGHGRCAELLPERITLDEWGILNGEPVPVELPSWAAGPSPTAPRLPFGWSGTPHFQLAAPQRNLRGNAQEVLSRDIHC